MVAAQFILQFVAGLPSPAVIVSERIAGLLPGEAFSALIDAFQFAAKPLLLLIVVVGEIALAGLLGVVYARAWDCSLPPLNHRARLVDPPASRVGVRGGITFAAIVWALVELLFFSWAGGYPQQLSVLFPALGRGITLIAYGVVLALAYAHLVRPLVKRTLVDEEDPRLVRVSRGQLVGWVVGSAIAVALGGLSMRLVGAYETRPTTGRRGLTELPPEITPTAAFYHVSKNFIDPSVDGKAWRLQFDGLVAQPFELTYQDLKSLPFRQHPATLLCISNEVGGDLISNGEWTVTSLGDLIARAVPTGNIRDVVLHAADGYEDSIPLAKALESDCVIAWELNGDPLTTGHGYPARLLVPGIYGMKNVKWLTRVELVGEDVKGFWQSRGWDDTAEIRSMSRIDFPGSGSSVAGPVIRLGGVAFCGDRGVGSVEISTDGGQTWSLAALQPPTSNLTWALWTYDWHPQERGEHRISVRAVDRTGQVQIVSRRGPFPAGSTGLHTISLLVQTIGPQPAVAPTPIPPFQSPRGTDSPARRGR